jgi:hypothetical protein
VTDLPPFLWPFVLPHTPVQPVSIDGIDYYLPERTPAPAMVFVHGGPPSYSAQVSRIGVDVSAWTTSTSSRWPGRSTGSRRWTTPMRCARPFG